MKKLAAIIEKAADGGYGVYLINEMFSGMGPTPEAAKKNLDNYLAIASHSR